jgi:MinD superfamily P-loop ATPase
MSHVSADVLNKRCHEDNQTAQCVCVWGGGGSGLRPTKAEGCGFCRADRVDTSLHEQEVHVSGEAERRRTGARLYMTVSKNSVT